MQGQSQLLPRLRPLILRIPHPRALSYTKTFRKPELVVVAKSNTSPTLVNTSQSMYSMGLNNAEILNFENCCECVFTRLVC
jgi:hypothetical protein